MRYLSLRRNRSGSRRTRGQSLVELALILPVFLVLIAAALDLGRIFYGQITVANAAREGAMEAATSVPVSWTDGAPCDVDSNRVMCRVLNEAKGSFVAVTTADVDLTCDPDPCARGIDNKVTVSVDGHFTLITPLMAVFTGGQNVTFTSTATSQIATPPSGGVASTPTPSPTATATATATATPTASSSSSASATAAPTPTPTPVCQLPVASFSVDPTSGFYDKPNRDGTVFAFTDASQNMTAGCNPVWSWNFGEGAGTTSIQHPTYFYSKHNTSPGYTVTLVVTNTAGTSTFSLIVPVFQ
jgi:Flp pilus assembly protein TadG